MGLLVPCFKGNPMTISNTYNDMQLLAVGAVPKGCCDALFVAANGNLALTTFDGTAVAAFAVTAGMQINVRTKSLNSGTTATVYGLYGL